MRLARRKALKILLASGLFLLTLPSASEVSAQANQLWIDAQTLYSHVEHLAQIPRPPATETEFAAVVYVDNALRSYGYQTTLQPFSYYTYREPSTLSLTIEGWPDQQWFPRGLTYGINGIGRGIIVSCGQGTATDFQRVDAQGKIAFVKRGANTYAEKVRQAAAAGAVAVIIQNDGDETWSGSLEGPLDMAVPVISLSREQSRLLEDRMSQKGELIAAVKVDGAQTSKQTSYNLIASKKPAGGGTNQTVLVSSHHDSAPKSPGASNGASGVAVMLEVARNIADLPIDTEVRLVSFGAASAGEQGPRAYVQSLPDTERQKIIAAFCLDAVGSKDAGDLIAATQSNVQNLPARLAVQSGVLFSSAGAESGASRDDQPLDEAGIPAALITRAPEDAWRDRAEDTVEKISPDRLVEAASAVTSAVMTITDANSPAYPRQESGGAKRSATPTVVYQ